ncbi:MAG: hypothetical protein WDO16_03740 [Bacteroidota bacterium]
MDAYSRAITDTSEPGLKKLLEAQRKGIQQLYTHIMEYYNAQ